MSQSNRLAGGLVDRKRSLAFSFDGRQCRGHPGDTLASALLANGVRLVGRSFKYHRPRGVLSAGQEEPNALVELRRGARREPNTRATAAELYDGLEAASQNRWPSLAFDAMAVNDLLAPLLSAGFYYKTFMWPAALWERLYEPLIRRAAGLGRLSTEPDPDVYDKGFLHCDVLVVGAGPAGLMAGLTAGRAGARVIVAEEDFLPGGRLNAETFEVGGMQGHAWAAAAAAELAAMPNVRLMTRTAVLGAYDHGTYAALERVADHVPTPPKGAPRQVLWRIHARRALLCAGAIERPVSFENNDRPGIMLAGAVRTYVNRFAVAPGRRIAVFTNNDDGVRTVHDLRAKGVEVAALIDSRKDGAAVDGVPHLAGARVIDSRGRLGLRSVTVRLADGTHRTIDCEALGVSGGWNPNLGLTSHQGSRPTWNPDIAAFVPGSNGPAGLAVAGAAAGRLSTHDALASGDEAARSALSDLGFAAGAADLPAAEDAPISIGPLWHVGVGGGRSWVDFQNDVTVKDVRLAHRENFRAVEHLKRYTTLGMATDQGKTSNVLGLALMAELTGKSIAETGTTVYRPPAVPVAIGALAGRMVGREFHPTRLAPSHHWAERRGAVFTEAGLWLRAQWFPQEGETHWQQAVDRETLAVRASVGVCDVTTLGKIDIQGTDAGVFLDRVYANTISTLSVGRVRYGLMLREDGMVMDDGTVARLAEHRYLATTTTANAVGVMRHLEFCRQCLWPDLDVQIVSVTEAWAQFAVAGPNSRRLLQTVVEGDISDAAFPYMACGDVTVCGGLRARLFRISFSGELAYEIAVPARYGEALLEALMAAGEAFGVVPYGLEALNVLRIEKGHVTGAELTGQVTALDAGFDRMVSRKKDAVGTVMMRREALVAANGLRLVGLKPVDSATTLIAGSHFIGLGRAATAENDEGWLTSAARSPHLGHSIGLGFVRNGAARIGERVRAVDLLSGSDVEVEIVSPHFIDPEGERLRG